MRLIKLTALVGLLISTQIGATDRQTLLQQNLEPVAQVNVAGAAAAAANAAPVAASGEDIYNKTCVTCHGAGVAGAPILGDKAAWAPRISSLGVDGLVKTAISGIKAMPPKGGCMNCSDDDIKAAVEYMVKKSS
jgi:cytochrome c5